MQDINDLTYGRVAVIGGEHKGSVGYYDDDYDDDHAVVLIEVEDDDLEEVFVPHEFLVNIPELEEQTH